ncbi:hypothetical protein JCM11641_008181 [Rhodosporidiobolus odoratus]
METLPSAISDHSRRALPVLHPRFAKDPPDPRVASSASNDPETAKAIQPRLIGGPDYVLVHPRIRSMKIIAAYSAAMLVLAEAVAASPALLPPHDLNLVPRYDHNAIGASSAVSDEDKGKATKFATIVAIHAVLGFLAFQVFMPLAVVLAAVGKTAFPDHWFKAHWRAQVFVVFPLSVLTVIMAVVAAAVEPDFLPAAKDGMDKHKTMGFILLGAVVVQMLVGWYSHHAHVKKERFAAENGQPEPAPKRRVANWVHLAIGITLLTLGGLQVTWGFNEYEWHVGQSIPRWIEIVHFVVAGVPVIIVTPFILVRGLMRMRDGQSFTEAFFSRPVRSQPYQPPRKLFLGTSTYIDETYGPSGIVFDEDAEKDGVGHEYAKGRGADGRMRVESIASSWPGHETREQYEADVLSQRDGASVVGSVASHSTAYDYVPYRHEDGTEEHSSLITSAAPMGSSSPSPGPSTFRPSQTPLSYPPTPASNLSVPPGLPSISPVFHSTSPSPSTLIASVAPTLTPPPAPANTFSPRLAFMPFSGPDAVLPPRNANDTPAYASTLASTPSFTRDSSVPVEVRTPPTGEGEAVSPALFVPSPPPPGQPPSLYSVPSTYRAQSVASSGAAVCDGDANVSIPMASQTSPRAQRHMSMAGQIEGTPLPGRTTTIAEETATEVSAAVAGKEAEERAAAAALGISSPGLPSSPAETLPAYEQGGEALAPAEAAHNEDVPLVDDSESARLFDELERELTISTMRSGRSRATAAEDDTEEGTSAVGAEDAATEISVDEETRLQREQSGKWFASGTGTPKQEN